MGRRRGCTFSDQLKKEFRFLRKSDTKTNYVICSICTSEFSISNGGRADINKHIKSNKHVDCLKAKVISRPITESYSKQKVGSEEKAIAAQEGLFAYHSVMHSHSFRSMDCTSKIIKHLFQKKFTCARTKAEAIIEGVFSPFALKLLQTELDQSNFVCVYYDSSNHKDQKMVPILVRYFLPKVGVQVKLLDFNTLPGETAELITNYLIKRIVNSGLKNKVIASCADNTNTNFGGQKRKGQKNVLTFLKKELNQNVIGVGCAAHIIHNAIKSAADCLPLDLESVVIKIYGHFYIYTVRVASLKEFCEFCDTEYSVILGYSKTRFLALRPALERILKMFKPLKSYFLSIEKCPKIIESFFNDPCSEIWLYFLHNQAEIFNSAVLKIEGEKNCIIQVAEVIRELKIKLSNRIRDRYVPLVVKSMMSELEKEGEIVVEKTVDSAVQFYHSCLDYLTEWTFEFAQYEKLKWIELKDLLPDWETIQSSLEEILKQISQFGKNIDDTELYDEFSLIREFVTKNQLKEWDENCMNPDQRWVDIFQKLCTDSITLSNVKLIIEFLYTLPGSNAVTERAFSIVNKLWTTEKTRLSISTLKSMLVTKMNIGMKCLDFFEFISKDNAILSSIHSSAKYNPELPSQE